MIEELRKIENLVFMINGFSITDLTEDKACEDYSGYNFRLKNHNIKFRKAKVTPKKTGQFVTLWKRNSHRQTEPFDIDDDVDFYIIATQQTRRFGFFFFPKNVLGEKHILTNNGKTGKRGFRVYPDWDIPTNSQAEKTKAWQSAYFIDLTEGVEGGIGRFKSLVL